ncbi:MAG: glycosyltransferase family 4 protein [Minisyncoccia bacterium]
MKVLFQNRKKAWWTGGDYIQMENTANALRKIGVEIDISEDMVVPPDVISKYDIVHLWNFSMNWTKYQLWVARKHRKPVVCSMIYHESDQFIPYNFQQIMLNELSMQIYLTESEKERVKRHLEINTPTVVIPNGIDDFWFRPVNISKDNIVLSVGRIEPNKGQLEVARACKKLGIPFYCAGECNDEEYKTQLLENDAILLGKLEPKELINWYERAKVVALVSKAEIFPLVVMEAMAQNCQIVLTTTSEWKPDVHYAEYGNTLSISKAISKAMKDNKDYKSFISQFKWNDVALKIKKIYEGIR